MRILNLSLFLSPPVQHIGVQVLINLYLIGYPEFPKIYYFYYKSALSSIERYITLNMICHDKKILTLLSILTERLDF